MQATNPTLNSEQIEKMTSSYMQTATDFNSMLRDTVNATLESVVIMSKGCSDLCNNLSGLLQKQMEQSVMASKSMMATRNVNEMISTQNDMIKTNLESLMTEINTISQLSSRIAQQAAEPVAKNANDAFSKFSKIKAA
ncbi:MAG: phasin family protein [Alphaproteobacteria bacterium]|nr:phasin family protein [Alphaproteobacteria bacterium]